MLDNVGPGCAVFDPLPGSPNDGRDTAPSCRTLNRSESLRSLRRLQGVGPLATRVSAGGSLCEAGAKQLIVLFLPDPHWDRLGRWFVNMDYQNARTALACANMKIKRNSSGVTI